MATDNPSLQSWEIIGIIITSVIAVCSVIYGIFRKLYCKGKDDGTKMTTEQNDIALLKEQFDTISSELDLLKSDIKDYRSKTEERLDTIAENQAEMKTDIEVTKTNVTSIKETIDRVYPKK